MDKLQKCLKDWDVSMSSVIKKGHMAQPGSLQNGYMYDNGQKSGKLTF